MLEMVIVLAIVIPIIYGIVKKIHVSLMLIISNFVIYFITLLFPSLVIKLAFSPSYLYEPSKLYTLLTSMFLHSTRHIDHILMNMLGLFFIGLPFENEIGAKKFLAVYFISGICASLAFSFLGGEGLLIGASGAIFGILGAFAASYPFKKVVVPLPVFIILFIRIPVIILALLYAGFETFYTFLGITDGIAHTAHLGGFVAGVFLSPFIKVKVHMEKISMDGIEELLTDENQRKIFKKAMEADEEEIRDAWLSYLAKRLRCPKCGGEIEIRNGIYCKKCGYRK